MIEDFYAINIDEFRKKYLVEKKLDKSYQPRMGGTLSKRSTELNIENADDLNSWATQIHNRISEYIRKEKRKNPEININVESLRMEDWRTQSAAILVVNVNYTPRVSGTEIQITVLDDNACIILLGDPIAKMFNSVNRIEVRSGRWGSAIDRTTAKTISYLERIVKI